MTAASLELADDLASRLQLASVSDVGPAATSRTIESPPRAENRRID
jgi:predicted transcriptional regulator